MNAGKNKSETNDFGILNISRERELEKEKGTRRNPEREREREGTRLQETRAYIIQRKKEKET